MESAKWSFEEDQTINAKWAEAFDQKREIAASVIKECLSDGPKLREYVVARLVSAVKDDAVILDAAAAAGVIRLEDSDNRVWWSLPVSA